MPQAGLFVTGTDTHVGKTWITAALAAVVRQRMEREGLPAHALRLWKPVQTGAAFGEPGADSYRLVQGSGLPQTEAETVSYSYVRPAAPWVAPQGEDIPLSWAALVEEGRVRLAEGRPLLVEGAGGWLVPLTGERTIADLAETLALPVLVVARPGLGTVNHTLLTVEQIRQRGLVAAGVILNGYRPLEKQALQENRRMIETFGRVPVLGGLPYMESGRPLTTQAAWTEWRRIWMALLEQHLDMNGLYARLRPDSGSEERNDTYKLQ